MKFIRKNSSHAESECGLYIISRAGVLGGGAYQAIRLGKPWRDRRGFDDSVSLLVARFPNGDENARVAAYKACVEACERDARAPRDE